MIEKLKQYTEDSSRTESTIPKIKVDLKTLTWVVDGLNVYNDFLDQIRKNEFYNKPYSEVLSEMVEKNKHGYYDVEFNTVAFHAILGLVNESVELLNNLMEYQKTRKLDVDNIEEEAGDIFWFYDKLLKAYKLDFEDVLDKNIAKLKARFPDKFDSDKAINRNVEHEKLMVKNHKASIRK